jgi:NADH-quinone oxidoreductase subunit C
VPLPAAEIGERLRAQFGRDLLSAADQFGHAVLAVTPERYVEMARFLRDDPDLGFDFFDFLTAVDYQPKGRGYELVVQVHSTTNNQDARLKLELPAENPSAPSLHEIWPGANWFEREAWEMFGIAFPDHPHLVKLELPEQFEGYPLRKEFALMTREAKVWPGDVEGEEIEQ